MTLTLHEHPFAAYCWKALIALYERDVPFERRFVGGEEDRATLAGLWPLGSIPVLVDDAAGLVLPESTTIVEYLDGHGGAPPLVPAEPAAALQARLWDRVVDGHVMTPMQKIVGDSLRPEGRRDAEGVAEAHAALDRASALLDTRLADRAWVAGPAFTLADCAAAPRLFPLPWPEYVE
jgi:glutathione S-transferase